MPIKPISWSAKFSSNYLWKIIIHILATPMTLTGGQQPNEEEKLVLSLPKGRCWSSPYVYLCQEFWCPSNVIQRLKVLRKNLKGKKVMSLLPAFQSQVLPGWNPLFSQLSTKNTSSPQRITIHSKHQPIWQINIREPIWTHTTTCKVYKLYQKLEFETLEEVSSTCTSSSRSICKKPLWTSIWWSSHFLATAIAKKLHTVTVFAIGVKVFHCNVHVLNRS